jgi:RNA polymerase sigma-32 factor
MTSTSYYSQRASEFRSVPTLSREEEHVLVHLWQNQRDELARNRLIEASMRHVVACAVAFRGYPVPFADLVAEGSIGLLIGIEKFDPSRKVRLVTYAAFWIRAYMFRAVIREWNRGRTGLGRRRHQTFFKLRKALAAQSTRNGLDNLDLDKLGQEIGAEPDQVREMLDYLRMQELSIDSIRDDETALHEKIADDNPGPGEITERSHDNDVLRVRIEEAMNALSDRERLILEARLMSDDPPSLAELGERLGVSRERVRQIEVAASRKLRTSLAAA